jgi:hypothetical protein
MSDELPCGHGYAWVVLQQDGYRLLRCQTEGCRQLFVLTPRGRFIPVGKMFKLKDLVEGKLNGERSDVGWSEAGAADGTGAHSGLAGGIREPASGHEA